MSFSIAGFKNSPTGVGGSSGGNGANGTNGSGLLKTKQPCSTIDGILWTLTGPTPYISGTLAVIINGSIIDDYVELPGGSTFEYTGLDAIETTGPDPDSVRVMYMI
jgi:hypothetical protein